MNSDQNNMLSGPGNKGKSVACSHHHLAESSSRNFSAEVKLIELDKRLRILEDEAEILKVAFLEGVQERRMLVNEIQNDFQAAFPYLNKRQRHGLPQILCEESNPAVVIRELRASEAVFHDATRSVCEFSHQ
ncbi:hypothetical protein HAX54_031473 [Datura stramonium]|uniref:Ternary complex factor MIP1 leucine-zipper domain-containing protein n=1 Tax=Datura stramonium TaxID=4076 RepID=A0ABS8VAK2_DATST|nr:hypothetical protein [Datura stramonium]